MRAFARIGIVVLVLFASPPAPAAGPAAAGLMLAAGQEQGRPEPPRIDTRQAAALVKNRYREGKILSVNLIQSKGPPVYRVKILAPGGVVKYVFVDGRSGDVFE